MATVCGGGYAMRPLPMRHRGVREALQRAAAWARNRALRADGFAAAATGSRASTRRRRSTPRAGAQRLVRDPAARESQEARCDARIVDWEALVDVLHATQRL
jgi:hypothetical protein